MKRFFILVSVLALVFSLTSCEKVNVGNINSIGYGTSFGMCFGYCVNNLAIKDENVVFSKINRSGTPDTKTCTSSLSSSEAKRFKELVSDAKLDKLEKTYGCPDCADGGAEWVSVTSGSKEYKVVFEYGKAPKELEELVVKLRALKDTFNTCN